MCVREKEGERNGAEKDASILSSHVADSGNQKRVTDIPVPVYRKLT